MNLDGWQANERHNYMPSIIFNLTSEFGDYHEGEH